MKVLQQGRSFDSNDLYKTVDAKIVAIAYALINNHGFIDGNKRIGITVMIAALN